MSITTKKPQPAPKRPAKGSASARTEPPVLRVFDAIYRFLASLKLAVLTLGALAAVLAYATFFEKSHGTAAVQEYIYRSPWFAILLAFLGTNVLCAALIRFPWSRRQLGFVITHAGLLIVLAGSWLSLRYCDEWQLKMVEGQQSNQVTRIDDPAIRVQRLDPETGQPREEIQYPFHAGSMPWEASKLDPNGLSVSRGIRTTLLSMGLLATAALVGFTIFWGLGRIPRLNGRLGAAIFLGLATLAVGGVGLAMGVQVPRAELITPKGDPLQITVKDFMPASGPIEIDAVPADRGIPMLKASLLLKPPNSPREVDVFNQFDDDGSGRNRWLTAADPKVARDTRDLGPLLLTFQYVHDKTFVQDFLTLPKDPINTELVRIHYADRSGNPRVFTWPDNAPADQVLPLPESDLELKLNRLDPSGFVKLVTTEGGEATRQLLRSSMQSAFTDQTGFLLAEVTRSGKPIVKQLVASTLPLVPNLLDPSATGPVRISYFHPPQLSKVALQGRSGVVDLMGTSDGKVYYRAFSREGLRGEPGELSKGTWLTLVQGSETQPVTFRMKVDEYLTSGAEREIVQPVDLPPNQRDNGIPACLIALTAHGETREFWLRRKPDDMDQMQPDFRTVTVGGEHLRLAFDSIRSDIPFTLKLTDFEVEFDPGTETPSAYTSQVLLTDPQEKVTEKPETITMNEPLMWRGYTFYQSGYEPIIDPRSNRKTGRFATVLQVRYDPIWKVTYFGCLLVVIGTFVQFYMRSGVFTSRGEKPAVVSEEV